MSEKPPTFTVTDRRKFTTEGERRDDGAPREEETSPKSSESTARVITMPSPRQEEPSPAVEPPVESNTEELQAGPSAQESAEQHAAYQQSAANIDAMLRQANPGMEAAPDTSFDHVTQSIYLSAMMAMGAGTEPGQKPRIDIIGARQSIDMLSILQEKTKGNLTEKEQRLLQNALFDLRMMFVEITNAITQSAQRPPEGK